MKRMKIEWSMFIGVLVVATIYTLGINTEQRLKTQAESQTVVIEKSVIPNEYLGEFETTHYTHTGNKCSTGVYPKVGRTVAVDPKIIPYGTYLYVEGYGVRIAEDCGGAIKNNRLDIFVDSHQEAVQLGRKKVKIWKLAK